MTVLADLPTGTVTFLFTDLEGSTRLLEAHPHAYREAVCRHHDLLREAVEAHGGAVFETVGDAVYAAFARPTDAVAAALAGQRALHREPWGATGELRVRMGVHLGEVEAYPMQGAAQGARYFGQPLVRCARLMATAHGGQTVLSEAVTVLVQDGLPAGAALRDLGAHRLKDLQRPERVAQLLHPDLPAVFPPLRSLEGRPHNLPRQATPFVGRERELAAVAARLGRPEVALVTLTGPGGTGKTRLALQAAAEVLDATGPDGALFPDGAWLVDLAPLDDPAQVPAAIARALGMRPAGRPLLDALTDHLRDKRLLLLLDNFEQLLPAAPAVAALLRAGPGLTALVTSRAALRLTGEQELPVPPLALPALPALPAPSPSGRRPDLDVRTLTQYEAVALFVQRAVAVKPDFAVTNANAPAVAEICVRLDGLPLALEAAAARVKLLPPEALLARLGRRLQLLTGGARDAPARQQTLRNTLDWSHDLLDAGERTLFARLAVFAGGWTLAAAEAVGRGDDSPSADVPDVLDGLAALVDKSLLRQEESEDQEAPGGPGGAGQEPRYRLLETVREYALERLEASGEAEAVRRRHAAHYLGLAERAPSGGPGAREAWLARLDRAGDDLPAALTWGIDRAVGAGGAAGAAPAADAAEHVLRLGAALLPFWRTRGHTAEGARWLAAVRALRSGPAGPDGPGGRPGPLVWARALAGAGTLADEYEHPAAARPLLEESVALFRRAGAAEPGGAAAGFVGALLWLGRERAFTAQRPGGPAGWAAGRPQFEEALPLARQAGDREAEAWLLVHLADSEPDPAAARARRDAGVALMRATGSRSLPPALRGLGLDARRAGDPVRARALFEESVALAQGSGAADTEALGLWALADLDADEGDPARAAARLEEALALWRHRGQHPQTDRTLLRLARLARTRGDRERAVRLEAEGLAPLRDEGEPSVLAEALLDHGRAAREAGDPAAAAYLEEAVALYEGAGNPRRAAWARSALAGVAMEQGDLTRATALAGEVLAVFRGAGDESGDRLGAGWALADLAHVARLRGDPAAARARGEEAVALLRSVRDQDRGEGEAWALLALGLAAADLGAAGAARARLREALALWRRPRPAGGLAPVLEGFAGLAAGQGQGTRALRLAGAAAALRAAAGAPLPPAERAWLAPRLAAARRALDASAQAVARAEGEAMTLEQAVADALADAPDSA